MSRHSKTLIAQEAARILLESGKHDYQSAKVKAAERLGIHERGNLPRNEEIEAALREYQRLFRSDSQPGALAELREVAIKAMELLQTFEPRLVGPVLAGTADEGDPVNLHVFADTAEEVALFLMDRHIPYQTGERQYRISAQRRDLPRETRSMYRFSPEIRRLRLPYFPWTDCAAPLSPVDGKPMRRADLATVRALTPLVDQA